jgi:pyruvate ferredoxin oxidoreductase gamma subunit
MFEVRFHGRGGQGAVTAADLLALAAFEEGLFAHSFPSFGSERTGAPVVSFCRLADHEIRTREPVVAPDCVIVLDPTLVHQVDLLSGLDADGYLLVNTSRTLGQLGLGSVAARLRPDRSLTVPATDVARRLVGRPLPNAAMLGAFAALTQEVSLDAVRKAILERFGRDATLAQRNVAAAAELFEMGRIDSISRESTSGESTSGRRTTHGVPTA